MDDYGNRSAKTRIMTVSIIITSRNRREDLVETLTVLRALNPPPLEILVTADGCTDDTVETVRRDFPEVQLTVNAPGLGSVSSRDRMMRAARGEFVLSLDDDSHPVAPDFLALVGPVFHRHPEAAVVACLIDEGGPAPIRPHTAPLTSACWVGRFGNGAAIFHRARYGLTGGFPAFFIHTHEESDYAIQCHGLGFGVWFEPDLVIKHRVAIANRNSLRTDWMNARNEFWSVLLRCPLPLLPFVALFRALRQFQHACRMGWPWVCAQPLWWWEALRGLPQCIRSRRPITGQRYAAWMQLARRPIADSAVWRTYMRASAPSSPSQTATPPC